MSQTIRRWMLLAAVAMFAVAAGPAAQVADVPVNGGPAVNQLNWRYIGLAVLLPPLAGFVVAFPFWRKRKMTLGNIFASAIIFATSIALILREYAEIDKVTLACLDAGIPCFPHPSAFTRFAIYACIGLVQVIAFFSISLIVDERVRRRDYAPEWR